MNTEYHINEKDYDCVDIDGVTCLFLKSNALNDSLPLGCFVYSVEYNFDNDLYVISNYCNLKQSCTIITDFSLDMNDEKDFVTAEKIEFLGRVKSIDQYIYNK